MQGDAMLCDGSDAQRQKRREISSRQKQASEEEGKESIGNEVQLNGCGNRTTANHQTKPNKPDP